MSLAQVKPSRNKSLESLPPLVLGAGVFNFSYHGEPDKLPCSEILKHAFSKGITALDTSAYYGPSETIVGQALKEIASEWSRDSYYICTKAGRNGPDEFDYSRQGIRNSLKRSLERLHTDYVDVLYIHDVEFNSMDASLEAIAAAFELKKEGLVNHVGISGYPVFYLLEVATNAAEQKHGPLDIVLSYCNMTLQNTRLLDSAEKFQTQAKVRHLVNASPLSMSLLRSGPTHAFHFAQRDLVQAADKASEHLKSQGIEMADLASHFALRVWPGSTVFGLSSVSEVDAALKAYFEAKDPLCAQRDRPYVEKVLEILGDQYNRTWDQGRFSGEPGAVCKRGF